MCDGTHQTGLDPVPGISVTPDWQKRHIGQLAIHVGSGLTPRGGSEVYKREGVLFIRSQNVRFEGLVLDDAAYIDRRTHAEMRRSEVFPHDVLLNITGASIGRCCPVPEGLGDCNVNQHVCAIRLPRPTRPDAVYLSSVLASPIGQSQIDRLNAGGNREGLNYEQLRSFVVPWPSSTERQGIAEILDTADEAIRGTEALVGKLKAMKAGLLDDLLTRGLDEHGHLRDPATHPEQFKESPLGEVPSGWAVMPFEEALVGVIDFRGRTPRKLGMEWGGGDIPALSANNVEMGQINLRKETYYGSEKLYERWMTSGDAAQGDIVMTMEAPLGNVAQIPDDRRYIMSQRVILLRTNDHLVVNSYLRHLLMWVAFQRRMKREATGTTATGIQRAKLYRIPLILPPTTEQQAIAGRLDAHDARIRAEEAYLEKLKLQKKGLMHDLLTGRVRPPN